MKRITKILSLLCAGSTVFTSSPVYAYELDGQGNSIEEVEYQNSENEDFLNDTSVFAKIGSNYEVTIPKVIILDGLLKKASYNVKATGDIAGYETIYIIPDDVFNLYSKNKAPQEAFITQNKTSWSVDDFNIDATGYVDAPDITAGHWSGTFNFNISLAEEQVLGDIILPNDFNPENFGLKDIDYRLLLEKIQKEPGLYDNSGELIITYDDLVDNYHFNSEIDNEIIESVPLSRISEIAGVDDVVVSEDDSGSSNSTYTIFKQPVSTSPAYVINTYFPETSFVSLPSSVTKIGSAAFARTNIKYIYFDNIEEIGNYAFASTNLLFSNIPTSTRYIGKNIYYDTPVTSTYYGTSNVIIYDLDIEDAIVNNKPINITLEKGYDYKITALYNFHNDVTKQSTITVDNSNILKFIPDCTLHTIACGTTTIRGTYTTKSGIKKDAAITVTIIDGNDDTTRKQPSASYLITIDYTDVDGNKLKETDIRTVISGTTYNITAPEFNDYELLSEKNVTNIATSSERIVFKYKKAPKPTNAYINTSKLAEDYSRMAVGNYTSQTITLDEDSELICDIYRVADNTVLTNSVFANCKAVDANTQVIIGKNLTVAAGTTLTPPYRCKGIIIIDTGTFTNNGTISMTARGAQGKGVDIPLVDGYQIDAIGGTGGSANTTKRISGNGIAGKTPQGISCGGGGTGGYLDAIVADGGSGTSFSGGAGSGGAHLTSNPKKPSNYGGAGSDFTKDGVTASNIGGGAGNNGGKGYGNNYYKDTATVEDGRNGTGGLIVIMANNLVNKGSLTSIGSNGGGTRKFMSAYGIAGGSSGGGCIVLIGKTVNNTGKVNTAGGIAVTPGPSRSYYNGGAGGAGTFKTIISNNLPF